MADPNRFDLADWFTLISTSVASGIVAGISAAMAWFRRTRLDMFARIDGLEASMKSWNETKALHDTQLAVMQNCQKNTEDQLIEIKETTRDTNQNVKELTQTLTQALLAMQSQKK